jgi:pimeloyl-ACP methyl ester carboxylesterase
MRTQCLIVGCLLAALSACDRPSDGGKSIGGAGSGLRRAGLWRQTIVRDGRPTPFGAIRICVDEATDAKLTLIGHAVGGSRCTRTVARQPDRSIRFHSVCGFGRGGVVDSTGSASSDFSSTYHLHADSIVHGSIYRPMNGLHATDIRASYIGPCPSDMAPGEIIIGPGLKVNLDRLPIAGAAAAFG